MAATGITSWEARRALDTVEASFAVEGRKAGPWIADELKKAAQGDGGEEVAGHGDVGAAELVERGFDPGLVSRVVRLTDAAEWKRRQYPPGTKITPRAFGRDRRLPVTNLWREPLG